MPGLDGVTIVCDTCGHRIEMGDVAAHVCPSRVQVGPRRAGTPVPRRDDLLISAIQIDSESVTIQYLDKGEVRGPDGGLVMTRQVTASKTYYRDEVSDLEDTLATFVLDILEDFAEAPRWQPQDDDDDERGMGW